MSAENVLRSFTIELGAAVDAKVRLLDPSGTPLGGQAVQLACRHPLAPHGWSPPETTNAQGECGFTGLNPDLEGHYVIELHFTKDFVPATVPLKLRGKTTVFHVEIGKVITGILLDVQGKPLAGKTVLAHPVDWSPWKTPGSLLYSYQPIAATDSHGRFRFSNLPPAKMKLQGGSWAGAEMVVMPTTSDRAMLVILQIPR